VWLVVPDSGPSNDNCPEVAIMVKILKTGLWLRLFAALGLVGGLGNTASAEDWAEDQWGTLSGRELDIAAGIELTWGVKIMSFGALLMILTQLTRAGTRARTGATLILVFVASEIATVSALSGRGYGEDASFPVAPLLTAGVLAVLALASCIAHWNDAADA
jgi:hypothetical protein